MRLGLMVYGPLDQLSGGYLYDRQFLNAFAQAGHEVQVISLPQGGYVGSLLHNWDRRWRDRLLGLELDCLIQDELCHPSLFLLNPSVRGKLQYPLISLVHHLALSENQPVPWRWLQTLVERKYLRSVDGFIFNSNPTKSSVERAVAGSVSGVVAPPGRDHLNPTTPSVNIKNASDSRGLRVLFVGNLIERKGLHWLLAALKRLADDRWQLEVIGRADLEPNYAQHILRLLEQDPFKHKVTYHGPVKQQSLAQHYRNANLLAVPSSHEGFGLVYLEAMGYGIPVLASASGGASDLVKHGQNGFLIPPGDVDELQRRLQQYLFNPGLIVTHGRAARARFKQQPTWSESAQQVLAFIYEDVLR